MIQLDSRNLLETENQNREIKLSYRRNLKTRFGLKFSMIQFQM